MMKKREAEGVLEEAMVTSSPEKLICSVHLQHSRDWGVYWKLTQDNIHIKCNKTLDFKGVNSEHASVKKKNI